VAVHRSRTGLLDRGMGRGSVPVDSCDPLSGDTLGWIEHSGHIVLVAGQSRISSIQFN